VGTKGFIRKSLLWRRSQFASVMMIPLLVLGVPAEYFWREEAVKRDYDRIERLGNGDPGERAAVLNLVGGCWADKAHEKFAVYFRERFFGNCRSLENAKLEKANLNSANLSAAMLDNSNLSGANLDRASLSGAMLFGANLSRANLNSANLSGAMLDNSNLSRAILFGANLSGAILDNTNLSGARLFRANLSGAILDYANLSEASLDNANLSGASLFGANLENAKFGCTEDEGENQQKIRKCPNLKDIKWDEYTNWQGIQGWENVQNIPPALKQQLGLKNTKN
jgi:hypothetical protein